MSTHVAELKLAPSRNEILLARSQELQANAFIQNQLKNIFLVFHWAWSLIKSTLKPKKEHIYNIKA